MNFKDIDEIKKAGFTGFKKISELFVNTSSIDKNKGIYLVLYPKKSLPKYLSVGSGPALYKKKINPNITLTELKSKWVNKTIVLYIGKAGGINKHGIEIKETLRKRIRKYLAFGKGKDSRHWGGRLIWQLKNSNDLIICWKKLDTQEPRKIETNLIKEFKTKFKQRPFANLKD